MARHFYEETTIHYGGINPLTCKGWCILWNLHTLSYPVFYYSRLTIMCPLKSLYVSEWCCRRNITTFVPDAVAMWTTILTILYTLFVLGVVIVILTGSEDIYRMFSWLMVVLFLPVIGIILYLLFGRPAASMRLIAKGFLREINRMPAQHTNEHLHHTILEDPYYGSLGRLLYKSDGRTILAASSMEVFTMAEDKYRKLFDDIRSARHEIHIMYYIIASDALGAMFRDLLVCKAEEGIKVRVIYDGLGSFWSDVKGFWRPLRRAGGEVHAFLPVRLPFVDLRINYRNHRKVVVIDQHIGYLGGMNVALYYAKGNQLGDWRDTHFRIEGSAVAGLQRIFLVDWAVALHQRFDPAPYFAHIDRGASYKDPIAIQFLTNGPQVHWQTLEQALVRACAIAQKEILIQTPYFLPPAGLLMSLCSAALRGVHVCLMLPERNDSLLAQYASESYLTQLLEAGVQVRRYSGGFLHAKLLLIDRCMAGIGSANMDFRSLEINLEVMAFVYDKEVSRVLSQTFEDDLKKCHQLSLGEWEGRSLWRRSAEAIARLFSPLL